MIAIAVQRLHSHAQFLEYIFISWYYDFSASFHFPIRPAKAWIFQTNCGREKARLSSHPAANTQVLPNQFL